MVFVIVYISKTYIKKLHWFLFILKPGKNAGLLPSIIYWKLKKSLEHAFQSKYKTVAGVYSQINPSSKRTVIVYKMLEYGKKNN